MNKGLLRQLFNVRFTYSDPLDQQHAGALIYIQWFVLFGAAILALRFVLPPIFRGDRVDLSIIFPLFPVALMGFSLLMVQTGYLKFGAYATTLFIYLSVVLFLSEDTIATPAFIGAALPMVTASLTLNQREYSFFAGLTLGTTLIIGIVEFGSLTTILESASLFISYTLLFFLGVTLYLWGDAVVEVFRASLGEINRLRLVSQFTHQEGLTDETQVMAKMVNLIRNELNYGFAQIFLVNERGMISQRYRTGLNMPEGGVFTEVTVGDASLLLEALRRNEAMTAAKEDSPLRLAHLLPASRYGAVFPLQVDGQMVGVLDVQKETSAFSEREVMLLQTLAKQMETLWTFTRNVTDLRTSLASLQATVESVRTQLREYKQTEREQVSETWANYLSGRNRIALGYDLGNAGTVGASDLPLPILEAMRQGDVNVREEVDGRQTVFVPVVLRGEVLGALTFDIPGGATVSERQLNFARSVTTRLALALENRRLFEASQAQANRERKANEIAGVLIGATEVNDVLALAAQQFNEALGAVGTRVRLDVDLLAEGRALEETRPKKPTSSNGGKA